MRNRTVAIAVRVTRLLSALVIVTWVVAEILALSFGDAQSPIAIFVLWLLLVAALALLGVGLFAAAGVSAFWEWRRAARAQRNAER